MTIALLKKGDKAQMKKIGEPHRDSPIGKGWKKLFFNEVRRRIAGRTFFRFATPFFFITTFFTSPNCHIDLLLNFLIEIILVLFYSIIFTCQDS